MAPEQEADMIRLRAECLAQQAENQAQWHQLCNAITDVRLTQMLLLLLTCKYSVQASALSSSNCTGYQ